MRRSEFITTIKVVGALTEDVIGTKRRTGGGVYYSSLGVLASGANVEVVAIGGHTSVLASMGLPLSGLVAIRGRRAVFEISHEGGSRKLVLLRRPIPTLSVSYHDQWAVVNPVCGEIRRVEGDHVFIDVQGFVRLCEERRPIEVDRTRKLGFKVRGAHANYTEVPEGGLPGREVLISYDEDGFDIIIKGEGKHRIKPSIVGDYGIGTGDFLLGAYVGYRAKGLRPLDAAVRAQRELESFSTLGPDEWIRRTLGSSSQRTYRRA